MSPNQIGQHLGQSATDLDTPPMWWMPDRARMKVARRHNPSHTAVFRNTWYKITLNRIPPMPQGESFLLVVKRIIRLRGEDEDDACSQKTKLHLFLDEVLQAFSMGVPIKHATTALEAANDAQIIVEEKFARKLSWLGFVADVSKKTGKMSVGISVEVTYEMVQAAQTVTSVTGVHSNP